MNLVNYIDRYIVTALLPDMQNDLHMTDTQAGFLGTAFIVVYLLASPFFGWIGDHGRRPAWLAAGVGVWSMATAATGLARHYTSLIGARTLVGIGEAAYGTLAPSLIADYFSKSTRGRILSYFYLATPVGCALGYLLGGLLGARYGWRSAFGWVGIPGIFLAAIALLLPDPPRGSADAAPMQPASTWRSASLALAKNRLYLWTVAGYTAYTFALGGLAFWAPSYMIRVRHYEQAQGMLIFGGITIATGCLGTLLGGFLGDKMLRRSRHGYCIINAVSMLGATFGTVLALVVPSNNIFLGCLIFAQINIFLSTGPVNALIVGAVPAHYRSTAIALSVFCIHLLGDSISPTLMGGLADNTSLADAMLSVPAFFAVAGILWAVPWLQAIRVDGEEPSSIA